MIIRQPSRMFEFSLHTNDFISKHRTLSSLWNLIQTNYTYSWIKIRHNAFLNPFVRHNLFLRTLKITSIPLRNVPMTCIRVNYPNFHYVSNKTWRIRSHSCNLHVFKTLLLKQILQHLRKEKGNTSAVPQISAWYTNL